MNNNLSARESAATALATTIGSLVGMFTVFGQLFGALNAVELNWIPVAPDLRPYAAGLSTLVSIPAFVKGWIYVEALQDVHRRLGQRLSWGIVGIISSFLLYWLLNTAVSTDSPDRAIAISTQGAFLLAYALPFGFLSWCLGMVSAFGRRK